MAATMTSKDIIMLHNDDNCVYTYMTLRPAERRRALLLPASIFFRPAVVWPRLPEAPWPPLLPRLPGTPRPPLLPRLRRTPPPLLPRLPGTPRPRLLPRLPGTPPPPRSAFRCAFANDAFVMKQDVQNFARGEAASFLQPGLQHFFCFFGRFDMVAPGKVKMGKAVVGSAERPLKSHNGDMGTIQERAPRPAPASTTGCAGIPVTDEARPEAESSRGPLAVARPPIATRKGLRPTRLVARGLCRERLSDPFEPQWRHRQGQPLLYKLTGCKAATTEAILMRF